MEKHQELERSYPKTKLCLLDTIGKANPEWKTKLDELENATTLSVLIMVAWQLARVVAVRLVEEVLAKRSQAKTEWELCEKCGKRLQSKGFKPRQLKSIIGVIKWKRRVGRCPNKCAIGQVIPLDKELGLASNQKSDNGLQQVACLVASCIHCSKTICDYWIGRRKLT